MQAIVYDENCVLWKLFISAIYTFYTIHLMFTSNQWSWSDTINDLFLDISELSNHVCPAWWWCLSAVWRQQELPTVQMARPVSILYSCRYRGNGNCEPVYSTDLLYFAVRLQHNRKLAGGWDRTKTKDAKPYSLSGTASLEIEKGLALLYLC